MHGKSCKTPEPLRDTGCDLCGGVRAPRVIVLLPLASGAVFGTVDSGVECALSALGSWRHPRTLHDQMTSR